MELSQLTAISPIDGRYGSKLKNLRSIFSEYGLIYYRCKVEVQWLIKMSEDAQITGSTDDVLSPKEKSFLLGIVENFSLEDAELVKSIESTTNHDVKAVEYFLQQKIKDTSLKRFTSLIHFACTSEDINNLSYALMFKDGRDRELLPLMKELVESIMHLSQKTANIPMLSRTHGQPASPTTMGKELLNSAVRMQRQFSQMEKGEILGKINGAVGNFNAHASAYPDLDWREISKSFVQSLGLKWNLYTTQIEPHDWIAESLHTLMRFNTILIDFNRDVWGYISLNYFSQKKVENEVGSSTMPHKINPIDFENSEGNLGVANAIASHLAEKLPISRWQRDLTDSTVLRNLGSVFAFSILSFHATLKGISKLIPNEKEIRSALSDRWEVLGEAIQSVMRRHGILDAYEQVKASSRGKQLDRDAVVTLINNANIPQESKERLLTLTPETYIGLAESLSSI